MPDIKISMTVVGATLSDSSLLEFQRGNTEISLKCIGNILSDDFNDNSLDGAKWTEHDSGTNVNEVNQRIEVIGIESWDVNGIMGKVGVLSSDAFAQLTVTVIPNSSYMLVGITDTFTVFNTKGCSLYFYAANTFKLRVNNGEISTNFAYIQGKTYNIRMVMNSKIYFIYIQSPNDSNYTVEKLIGSVIDIGATATIYPMIDVYSSNGVSFIDNVVFGNFDSTSPTATLLEVDSGNISTVWDMSSIKDTRSLAGETGTIKYQYSCHAITATPSWNGSWLTLIELQAISDPTGRYFQLKMQFISGGTQDASISDVNILATIPVGGGGGLLVHPGHRGGYR